MRNVETLKLNKFFEQFQNGYNTKMEFFFRKIKKICPNAWIMKWQLKHLMRMGSVA